MKWGGVKYLLIVLFILVLITITSKTKKNIKRTAILVFGQPRTYKKCYQSLFYKYRHLLFYVFDKNY